MLIVRLIDLPVTVKGFTVMDEDGCFNIYLNARLNDEARVEAYRHELDHIRRGHFYSELPVAIKEMEVKRA